LELIVRCISVVGYEFLADNLRLLRLARRWSQRRLADEAGAQFTESYLSRLECGQRPTDIAHIDVLAVTLGISRRQLLKRPRAVPTPVTTANEQSGPRSISDITS
jgi:transcriptional regulator with XRE-family HTH domain